MRKTLCRGACALLAGLLMTVSVPLASASDQLDYVVDNNGEKAYIPLTYTAEKILTLSSEDGGLKNPQDMCLGVAGTEYADHLFIADTDNSRVVILDAEGKLVRAITEADGKTFLRPSGVTVDKDNDIYISDTGNGRIVHTTVEGAYVESFYKPETELLEDSETFDITRIALTEGGLFYVMRGSKFLMMDAENKFQGLVGSTRVPYSLTFLLVRMFASQEQLEYYVTPEPAAYTAFTLGNDGLLYATIEDSANQIQIVNGNGDNVYVKQSYGEQVVSEEGTVQNPSFSDITVSDRGIISVLEKNSARIYQYDQQGNLLTVFGGKGSTKGFFTAPAALVAGEGNRLYVLDSSRGDITCFAPTSFINNVIEAAQLYNDGRYTEAYEKWQEVYRTNHSYPLANEGIALALYKSGREQESLEFYKLAYSQSGYSNAFDDLRHAFFREHFFWLVGGVVVLAVGMYFLLRFMKQLSDRYLNEYYVRKGEQRR